jgi:hypothetical protein
MTPEGKGSALKDRPEVLIMVNQGATWGAMRTGGFGVLICPESGTSKA